jgi:hypothetical protein
MSCASRSPESTAAPQMLRWLVAHGFELGDHTHDHVFLDTLDDRGVQRELVQGAHVITNAVPGYRIQTMALPLGALPHTRPLVLRGRWHSAGYRFAAAFLTGAEPGTLDLQQEVRPDGRPANPDVAPALERRA